jgi:hypothetical protein
MFRTGLSEAKVIVTPTTVAHMGPGKMEHRFEWPTPRGPFLGREVPETYF